MSYTPEPNLHTQGQSRQPRHLWSLCLYSCDVIFFSGCFLCVSSNTDSSRSSLLALGVLLGYRCPANGPLLFGISIYSAISCSSLVIKSLKGWPLSFRFWSISCNSCARILCVLAAEGSLFCTYLLCCSKW